MMHFGVPLLLQILNEYPTSYLSIFLHRKSPKGDRFYHLQFEEGRLLEDKTEVFSNGVYGTYIYMHFPKYKKVELGGIALNKTIPMSLKNVHYETMFEVKDDISKKIDEFQPVPLLALETETEKLKNGKPILIDYKETSKETLADFLRFVYFIAYKYKIKDVVLINMPIISEKAYFHTLMYILFPETKQDVASREDDKHIRNILFFDKESLNILFIGGKNREEFCAINEKILDRYGQSKNSSTSVFCDDNFDKKSPCIDTKLFFSREDNDCFLLPFELYAKKRNNEMFLFQDVLSSYLEGEHQSEDIHVDVGGGYHLKKFYFLKRVFENSTWVNRIAYIVAQKIQDNELLPQKEIVLIGVGKYSSLIMSLVHSLLRLHNEYFIVNNFDNLEGYTNFIEQYKDNKALIFFTPVIVNGENLSNLLQMAKSRNNPIDPIVISAIELYNERNIKKKEFDTVSLLQKDITLNIEDSRSCIRCFSEDTPLYVLRDDGFSIKNIYFDSGSINSSSCTTYISSNELSWNNVVYYGHTRRKINHYLYYTKTISFLKNNNTLIEEFLLKGKHQKKIDKKRKAVILAPVHETNNNFIAMVDKIVFENDATIYHFNLAEKEQNLYQLHIIKEYYKNNPAYDFYFVDDEISSGTTLEYFYTLLKEISIDKKFSGVFALINRTSVFDERLLLNYIEDDSLYMFTKLNIKPIKTNFEPCFLCERKNYFQELMNCSSLVFLKAQFRNRVKVLNRKEAFEIEHKNINKVDSFKNYIKMYAVEYIYSIINDKFLVVEELLKFTEEVKKYFYTHCVRDEKDNNTINIIIERESRIAFIKAMAFPKIVYFKKIRIQVSSFIVDELKSIMEKAKNEDISIKKLFLSSDMAELSKIENLKEFASHYANQQKTNIDYVNFLIVTAGYLNLNYILSYDMIIFYYKLSHSVKKNKKLKNELLHKYPLAVKMVTSYSEEKSLEFNKQFAKFNASFKIQFNNDYSLMSALYIENTELLITAKESFIKKIKIKKDTLQAKIDQLKELINELLGSCRTVGEIKFYVNVSRNPNVDLMDLFDSKFRELDDKNSIEFLLYDGAISDKQSSGRIKLKKAFQKDKDNIWSNYYSNDESKTYVRIVETKKENTPRKDITFRPVGIFVVRHEKGYNNHLCISRSLLMVQKHIVDFVEILLDMEAFSNELHRSKILEKIYEEEKSEHEKAKEEIIILKRARNQVNHSIKKYINIKSPTDNVVKELDNRQYMRHIVENYEGGKFEYLKNKYIKLANYTFGIYHLTSLTDLEKINKYGNDAFDIKNILENDFKNNMEDFLAVAGHFGMSGSAVNSNKNYSIDIDSLNDNSLVLRLKREYFEHFCYELIFNSIKEAYGVNKKHIKIKIKSINSNRGIRIYQYLEPSYLATLKDENTRPYGIDFVGNQGTEVIKHILEYNKYTICLKLKDDGDIPDSINRDEFKEEWNSYIEITKQKG